MGDKMTAGERILKEVSDFKNCHDLVEELVQKNMLLKKGAWYEIKNQEIIYKIFKPGNCVRAIKQGARGVILFQLHSKKLIC